METTPQQTTSNPQGCAAPTGSLPELLTCPFCGSAGEILGEPKFETKVFGHEVTAGGFYLSCANDECSCSLGMTGEDPDPGYIYGRFATDVEAVAAWNTRAGNSQVSGEQSAAPK